MIKAFIFDIGGTLVRTDEAIMNAVELALKDNNVRLRDRRIVINNFAKSNLINVQTAVKVSYSGSNFNKKIEECYKSFKSMFPRKVVSRLKVFPGVVRNLQLLRKRGIKLAVFTALTGEEARFFLTKLKLLKFFDEIVTVDDVKKPRPNPGGLLLEIKRLKVKKEECVYVGDSIADIQMAKKAKVKMVCVKTGVQSNKLLEEENPDYLIEGIPEMMNALSSELPG